MPKRNTLFRKLIPEPVFLSLLYRIFGLYILFSICRFLFIIFNDHYFTVQGAGHLLQWIWGGLVFDTVAIFYVNILCIFLATLPLVIRYRTWYQKIMTVVFVLTNTIAIAANLIDIFYYPFTLTRTTASVFQQFSNESNMVSLFMKFIVDYWYGTLIFILMVAALIFLARKTKPKGNPVLRGFAYYAYALVLTLITYTLFVGGVRGGYKHSTRPITLSNAGQYVNNPAEVNIVLNTPFCILKTSDIEAFSEYDFYPDAEVDSLFPVIHTPPENMEMNKKNVVIIILESFGKEFIGFFNRDKGPQYKSYTPFIDSLCQYSLTFKYSFANGRKSIDIMPSILVSIPSIVEPFIVTDCFDNNMQSLPYLLGKEGYSSSFFHGAPNGSMGYLAFSRLIGVDRYYGMDEYGNNDHFDGYWSIWDEEFFQFFADKLNEFEQPFISTIFSASSHHPFVLPEKYEGKFPEGPHPLNRTIGYTDMAVKRFFENVSKTDWYNSTIFIITADHCQSEPQMAEYLTSTGSFEVPIIFYTPDGSLVGEDSRLIQQIDIMPVVLGQLKYNEPYFAFGSDVLHANGDNCVVNYVNGTYQLFYRDNVIISDGKETRGLYRFKTDRLLEYNLTGQAGPVQDTLETKVKAFIQQYNNRMIENRINIP